MKPHENDEIWHAMEGLRDQPVVSESRDYAQRWARFNEHKIQAVRRLFGWQGLAAGACVAAAIVALLSYKSAVRPITDLVAGNAETRMQVLPDGSAVLLSINAHLRIAFTQASRDVELIDGQARFEVTKDPQRPFRVRAGPTEIVAVGTVFEVSELPTETTVTLIEGRVDIHSIQDTGVSGPVIATLLPTQQFALASDGRVVNRKIMRFDNQNIWQRGTVSLDDVSLTDAIANISKYSNIKIVVSDPSLATMRVSGVFRSGDPKAFVAALEQYFGLKAHWLSDRSVTLDRP